MEQSTTTSSTITPLRDTTRHITTHDPSTGNFIFESDLSALTPPTTHIPGGSFSILYTASPVPVNAASDADLGLYKHYISHPPGVVVPRGTGAAICDFEPGGETPMHRTVSLDYNCVIEGELELTLGGGETRVLRKGDVAVVRGGMHKWRNVTPGGGWARNFAVSHDLVPLEVAGRVLGEDWSG